MTAIHPFRALRYDPERVGGLESVVAPPYDVITAQEQEALYHASPRNIVRLILGKQCPTDTDTENRYTRARREFAAWCEEGILRRDPVPALYLVEHTFRDEDGPRPVRTCSNGPSTRLGLIALLGLDEATTRTVYRHEATLAAPKADRLKLLEAVPANLSPIFCVYPDPRATVQTVVQGIAAARVPEAHVTFHGETVRLWVISDEAAIEDMTRRLAETPVLIADGHHRFEVAWSRRARSPAVMTYFVSMADPALRVRPIHRIVRGGRMVHAQALRHLCTLEPSADRTALLEWLERDGTISAASAGGRFGYWDGRTLSRMTVRAEALAQWLMTPPVPLPLAMLDVSILHGLILPHLGVDPAQVTYAATASEALEAVTDPAGGGAWLLRGVPLSQVFALAAQGFTLPPKSTYFYPKVLSGLVLNPLRDLPV